MPLMSRFLVLAPALLCACSSDAQLSSRFASDFTHAPHTLAVLGVYKDGRMSSEAWEQVGPGLSRPFGATCDTGYAQLEAKNQALSGVVDDYARANGVGDDLLEQLAPAAQGDLILVVTVAGHVGSKGPNLPDTSTLATGTPGVGSSKYRTGSAIGSPTGATRGSGAMRKPIDTSAALEMTASLYSVPEKKSVGVVTLEYDGKSVDDAIARLAQRLGQELPGSRCGGWNWDAKIDDQRIRELGSP
ncbi:MAG TPA: hypothetical protein VF765_10440 [Polyangiaceae bacterium]